MDLIIFIIGCFISGFFGFVGGYTLRKAKVESCESDERLFSNKIKTDIKYEKDIINFAIKEIYMKGFNQSIENLDKIKLKLGEMRRFLNNDLHPLVSPDNYWSYSDLIDMVDELEVLLFPNKNNDVEK